MLTPEGQPSFGIWQRAAIGLAAFAILIAGGAALLLRHPVADASDLTNFLGRFHTLLVHMPIGVLLLVASIEGLSLNAKLRVRLDPAVMFILPLLVLSSVAAFVLGLLLARGGGYPANLVAQHRNFTLFGIVASALALAVWAFAAGRPAIRNAYRAVLLGAVALLTIGAHHGGTMTRGAGYLTRYAPEPIRALLGEPKRAPVHDEQPEPVGAEPLLFADVVLPLMKSRCVECHGAEKVKGDLRLDDLASILKGGENGAAVVPGSADTSLLIKRMLLPLDHDDHMPPSDKPQATSDEIELLRFWIDRGANDTLRVRDTLPPDGAKTILLRAIALPDGVGAAKPVSSAAPTVAGSVGVASASAPETALPSAQEPSSVSLSDGSLYGDRVAPILEARCVRCHGAEKSKGKLRLDSIEAMLKGGKGGPAVVANASQQSPLVTAMRLPVDNDEHMPPKKEPQATAPEIELVSFWIDHGASRDVRLDTLDPKISAAFVKPTYVPPAQPTPTAVVTASPDVSATPEVELSSLPPELHLYSEVITPVFREKCGTCHEGDGASAGFRTDQHAALFDASAGEPAVVPGKPKQSLLVKRLRLPLANDEHMPPSDMPQLTAGDIELVELWIARGAAQDTNVATAGLSKAARIAARSALALEASSSSPLDPVASASASSNASASASSSASVATPSLPSAQPPSAPSATATSDAGTLAPSGSGCASCSVAREREAGAETCRIAWLALAVAAWSRKRRFGCGKQSARIC